MVLRRNGLSGQGFRSSFTAAVVCCLVLGTTTPSFAASDPLTRFLDGIFKKAPEPAPVAKPRPRATQTRQVPKRPQPATVIVRDAQQKNEANTFIAVIGDSLGESLVGGLREAFDNTKEIAVVNRSSPTTNFTRASAEDWIFLTRDYTRESMPNPQPITLGVVFIGADEHRDLLDTDATLAAAGSPRWQALMAERVEALIRTFADRRIPLVWVGLPPMKSEEQANIATSLNALYRDEVLKAGGTFVDIWAGFSNDEKGFISTGPDVKGQETRLRTPDGIGLTSSGARKVAHFAEREIRRLLQARGVATVIATPEPEIASSGATLPDILGPVVIPIKPIAGPILPLLSITPAPDGKLIQTRSPLKGDTATVAYRVYGEGRMPNPVAGRADDFTWHDNKLQDNALKAPQKAANATSNPVEPAVITTSR